VTAWEIWVSACTEKGLNGFILFGAERDAKPTNSVNMGNEPQVASR
jgi:hypothetical protein